MQILHENSIRRPIITLLAVLATGGVLSGATFTRPSRLHPLRNSAVYSFCQDSTGAVWINTSYGLCRFTGDRHDFPSRALISHKLACNGDDRVYYVAYNGMFCQDIHRTAPTPLRTGDLRIQDGAMRAEADSVWVAADHQLLVSRGDSLWQVAAAADYRFSDLVRRDGGPLVLSDRGGAILTYDAEAGFQEAFRTEEGISTLHFDTQGRLWVGLASDGLLLLDTSFRPVHRWGPADGGPRQEVRSFCETPDGSMLVGAVDGLFAIGANGRCHAAPDGFPEGAPVWNIFRDRDDNIWVGTFYNGVYFLNSDFTPFHRPDGTGVLHQVSALAEDGTGDVWILTDRYGMFRYHPGEGIREIPSGRDIKFQSALYDPVARILWAGTYQGALLSYDPAAGTWHPYAFTDEDGEPFSESVNAILQRDGLLYLGTYHGVYTFDPAVEQTVSRKLFPHERTIYTLRSYGRDSLLVTGFGVFVYDLSTGRLDTLRTSGNCSDGYIRGTDDIYVCETGRGLGRLRSGDARPDYLDDIGLSDPYTSRCCPVSDDLLMVSSRSGVSLVMLDEGTCLNYNADNGLGLTSTRGGCFLRRHDGSVWIGGSDGIAVFDPEAPRRLPSRPRPAFDRIRVNDADRFLPAQLDGLRSLRLEPGDDNFSVDIADFDYSEVHPTAWRYMLKGFDGDWRRFSPETPLTYMNIPPGRYTLLVQYAPDARFEHPGGLSLSIRIPARWFASKVAKGLYLLLAMSIIIVLLYFLYAKMLLAQRLKDEEAEGARRMQLFIGISRQLRTPLSLIMGQLEMFLHRYGATAPGVKYIEHSYVNAKDMSSVISGFVDLENEAEPVLEIHELHAPDQVEEPDDPFRRHDRLLLIVSDNPEMTALLRSVFSSEYDLLSASGVTEGYNLACREQPDIIVCDIIDPSTLEPDLCTRLRQHFETQHIPFVLLTSHASERHHIESVRLGVDAFIVKPFKTELLTTRCRALLENRRILRDKYAMATAVSPRQTAERKDYNFLNAAIGAVERNLYAADLDVGKLCHELNLSKTALNVRLHAVTGLSPRDFIEDIRLRHAAQMLRDSHRPVGEVADLLGFSSPKYFTLRFKKRFGQSPSQYRDAPGSSMPVDRQV